MSYPIVLSLPDNEPAGHYVNLVGPLLQRYGGGPLDVVVDLGAHVGAFSILAIKEFGAKFVVAVEADPVNFSHLVVNIAENQVARHMLPVMACIGPRTGEVEQLYYAGTSGQQGTEFDPNRFPSITVRTLSLRDLFRLIPSQIDFLKMDIEGSEWSLFERPEIIFNVLKKVKYLDIEFHPLADPKYHVVVPNLHYEIMENQIERALKTLSLVGFDMKEGGERWDYYGFRK